MIKFILIILVAVFVVLIIVLLRLSRQFNNKLKKLYSNDKAPYKVFHHEQLAGLPEPVQLYFRNVLKEGQCYIHNARLKHDGYFKTGKDKEWIKIQGEQYFTTNRPGFIWKGVTRLFTACDSYIANKGRLVVRLLSLYPIVDDQGEKINQGELLRWLAESVWFPTNLLPGDHLQWSAVDSNSAIVKYCNHGLSVFYIVTFNTVGEIIQLETKRYMGEGDLETWVGKLCDYREMNGVLVPTTIEALWKLKEGDFSYARFSVTAIEYNRAERW